MADPVCSNVVAEVLDVGKVFPGPPRVDVLRGVNLRLHGGQLTAIMGPSGSGKSTLLNILGLLDRPTTGRCVVGGADAATMRERQRDATRSMVIGFVFQSFHLVPYLDCVGNVLLPLVCQGRPRAGRRSLAIGALERVGLGHRLGARPGTLSGGERQRVAIARAIVSQPALLLCDEPTGNLDSASTDNVIGILRDLVTPERAVVVVTHDAEVAARADRLIRMADGRVQ